MNRLTFYFRPTVVSEAGMKSVISVIVLYFYQIATTLGKLPPGKSYCDPLKISIEVFSIANILFKEISSLGF